MDVSPRDSSIPAVHLHRLGSMIDLARAKVRLREGMKLNVYMDSDETEDIEVFGTAIFDPVSSYWYVEFDPLVYRDVVRPPDPTGPKFPCWNCGNELSELVASKGLAPRDRCPTCDEEIHKPLDPPM